MPPEPRHNLADHRLRGLFEPEDVVVIGSTARPDSAASTFLKALRQGGFGGGTFTWASEGTAGGEVSALADLKSLPSPHTTLGLVAVRAERVRDVLIAAGEAGIRNLVVIAGGFAEVKAGGVLQNDLVRISTQYGQSILGPNTVGFANKWHALHATFADWILDDTVPGSSAIISQSGGIAETLHEEGLKGGLRFGYVVGVGNQAVIDLESVASYVLSDTRIRNAVVYAEGFRRGRYLLRIAQAAASEGKRIVVLAGGRGTSGTRAALSHTAVMSGSGAVFRQFAEQAGVGFTTTPEEAVALLQLLESPQQPPLGNRILVFTNTGGTGVLTADLAEENGLTLPVIVGDLRRDLDELLTDYASASNPIDPTPAVILDADRAGSVLRTASDPTVFDSVVVSCSSSSLLSLKVAHLLSAVVDDLQPFSLVTWLGGSEEIAAEFVMRATPYVPNAANALSALGKLVRLQRVVPWIVPAADLASDRKDAGGSRETITEDVVEADLARRQIRVAQGVVAQDAAQACEVARGLGFPVVMKVLSKDIMHRAKVGGVVVNIVSEDEIRKAFSTISESIRRSKLGAKLAGVLIQKQYDRAIELIVGMHDDASFGPVCLLGIGGAAVEEILLARFGLLPLTGATADEIVLTSPAAIQLNQAQRENLASMMVQLSDWWQMKVADGVKLSQVDLNPVLFESDVPVIADALAVVESGTWR